MDISDYVILKTLSNRNGKRVYIVQKGERRFVLKEFVDEDLAGWEFAACERIDSFRAPKYLDRIKENNKTVLTQEFISGSSGLDYLASLKSRKEQVKFIIDAASALKTVHDQGVVYNNLSLTNMLIDQDGLVRLFDFSLSFIDGRNFSDSLFKEGNLPYIAPENTGKVNRGVSNQSDLYSLGVIMYRALLGAFPFKAATPSEWISLHVAKKPEPPHALDDTISCGLSDIIMKLLEKDNHERYLTADGLLYDLEHFDECDFEIGRQDFGGSLQISKKVYGRDEEIANLRESIENVVLGESNFSVVAGYSGVGKSTLVREIYRQRDHKGCFFISGKFQQYKQSIPYFAFVEAFNEFVDQMLFSADEVIQDFMDRFHSVIGDQGKVLTSVFPHLELLVGPQKDIEKLMGVEAENRFKFVFLNFIDIAATAERPLILFIDDLQWPDIVSLNILKALVLSRKKYVMIFLAYRDNEVDLHHPFHQFMDEVKAASIPMDHIKLEDLTLADIAQLVADTLGAPDKELSRIIYDKTRGNSFFVHQFLKNLVENELVKFDRKSLSWMVDIKEVEALEVSENVVEFMQGRIQRMDSDALETLKLIGTIGHNVSLAILSIVTDAAPAVLEEKLVRPLNDGLLVRRDDHIYFVHDKIQQACYQLNDEKALPSLHFEIANILIEHGLYEKIEDLFTVTSHLTKGFSSITQDHDRYIEIYLKAGKKSREVSAYGEYLHFMEQAMELLPHSKSEELEFSCYSEYHIALHLNGLYDEADEFFEKAIRNNDDIFPLKDNYVAKVSQDSLRGMYKEATSFGLSFLDRLGISISLEPEMKELVDDLAAIRSEFKCQGIGPISDLLKIPQQKHQEMEFTCELISAIVPPSFFYNPMVSGLLIFATIKLALQNGVFEAMGYPFSTSTAPFIMIENNYKTGYEYAEFAIRISGNNKRSLGNSKHLFILFAYHWLKPLKDNWSLEVAREAFHLLQQGGDIQMAGFIYFNTIPYTLERGDQLTVVLEEIEKGLDFAWRTQNSHSLGTFLIYQQLVLTLMSKDGDVTTFSQNGFDEQTHIKEYETNVMSHCYYYIHKTMMLYIFGHIEEALPNARRAMELLPYITGFIPVSTAHYFVALVLCRVLEKDRGVLEELDGYIRQWEIWASYCRENWMHKLYLIQAEKARALGRAEAAVDFFGKAISEAKRNGFTQDIALCYERFADFWFENNNEELGEIHIVKAHEYFSHWGGLRKVRDLEDRFPDILATRGQRDYDLLNIIKAQNLLTQETRIETLVRQLMKILLEVSGAEKVFLLRNRREWRIEGFRDAQGNENVLQNLTLSDELLSSDMVKYTIRTGQEISLDKFSKYLSDNYIRRFKPKSILVLPVTSQSKSVAIIYLEHSGIENLFTPDKLEVIRLLSSQIAISLINAQMYDDLEALVDERTNKLEKQNQELIVAQQMAEEATKAKSSFLTNMSHEIRTPLNAIMGMANLALMTNLTMQQQDYISKIHSSGQHLLGVVNDILDFSKIEARKLILENVHFHLGSVLDNISSIVSGSAEEKNLELVFSCPPPVLQGYIGDPLRLSQILTNLIGNAIKFTEQGEIIIAIEKTRDEDKIAVLRFSVSDTGVGLSQDQVETLFQPFSQADASTTRKYGGTGLGLSICASLVEIMGGEIGVESQPGLGSIFYFEVPFVKAEGKRDPRIDSYKALLGKRILVVEDNQATRRALGNMLQAVGFVVEEAETGEEAIGRMQYKNAKPGVDLILMDWNLPGINGLEAANEIKTKHEGESSPAIIMITAYVKEDLAREAERIGLEGFLLKPVNPSMLVDTVARALTGQGTLSVPAGSVGKWNREVLRPIRGARILIAEDNELNVQILRELLEQNSFVVRVAQNGLEAIEILNRESFDLVFMDIQMPEMDGYETACRIRKADRFKNMPIVAMTAHAMESERQKCLTAGMNDHLAKPLDPGLLMEVLIKWITPGERIIKPQEDYEGPEASLDLPLILPGLNIQEALPRVSQNTALYRKLLASFKRDHENFMSNIQESLRSEQEKEAHRQAHALKGVAANIGAEEIQAVAAKLEEAILERHQDGILSALQGLDKLLAEVFRSIDLLVVSKDIEHELEPLDKNKVQKLLQEQVEFLDRGLFIAVAKAQDVKRSLDGHIPPAELLGFEQAVNLFDFEAAYQQTFKLADRLGIQLNGVES